LDLKITGLFEKLYFFWKRAFVVVFSLRNWIFFGNWTFLKITGLGLENNWSFFFLKITGVELHFNWS
jgi:hypothetical protein